MTHTDGLSISAACKTELSTIKTQAWQKQPKELQKLQKQLHKLVKLHVIQVELHVAHNFLDSTGHARMQLTGVFQLGR